MFTANDTKLNARSPACGTADLDISLDICSLFVPMLQATLSPATIDAAPPANAPVTPARTLAEQQLAMLTRLAEIGLNAAAAVERRALALAEASGEAGPIGTDPGLAYARIARAVRMTIALQSRLLKELAAPGEAEPRAPKLTASPFIEPTPDDERAERIRPAHRQSHHHSRDRRRGGRPTADRRRLGAAHRRGRLWRSERAADRRDRRAHLQGPGPDARLGPTGRGSLGAGGSRKQGRGVAVCARARGPWRGRAADSLTVQGRVALKTGSTTPVIARLVRATPSLSFAGLGAPGDGWPGQAGP